MNSVDQQFHVLMIICISVVVTVYICTGLWVMHGDTKLTRQLNLAQINTPFFGFFMVFIVFGLWPLKSVWGALIWTVNEYTELLE